VLTKGFEVQTAGVMVCRTHCLLMAYPRGACTRACRSIVVPRRVHIISGYRLDIADGFKIPIYKWLKVVTA
jgi:hypothetical protein